jgi:hypothetical protein
MQSTSKAAFNKLPASGNELQIATQNHGRSMLYENQDWSKLLTASMHQLLRHRLGSLSLNTSK